MKLTMKYLICLVALTEVFAEERVISLVGNPLAHARPCEGNDDVLATFEAGLPPEEENKYWLNIIEPIGVYFQFDLKFDSDATVTLLKPEVARISSNPDGSFHVRFFKPNKNLQIEVKGPKTGTIPYVESIKINHQEICKKPQTGYFDNLIQGVKATAEVTQKLPDDSCGRRKVVHTELIVNGQPTNPGDWPWHVALLRVEGRAVKYICGGTLISKSLVLTAGHCAAIRGVPAVPESLSVILGKHNLIGGDLAAQEREVFEVIVHPSFDPKTLNNDIALLKLKSEAVFDDYVQPACLWDNSFLKRLPYGDVYGTVVGWGFDSNDLLSTTLQQVYIPKISEVQCLKSYPEFFSKTLNTKKFCAGYRNGTSVCNGDSGGGFMTFVPDSAGDTSKKSGTWHVQGIVSMTLKRIDAAICDPYQYVLFTDLIQFKDWILKYYKD